MSPQETVDYHIKSTWFSIFKMYNQIASQHGYSQAVGHALLNIDAENGTPATQIATQMGLESTSLSRLLKSMEEQKLISRSSASGDKRKVIVMLTDKGLEKRDIARQVVIEFNNLIKEEVSTKKLENFFEVIQKINHLSEVYKTENEFTTA